MATLIDIVVATRDRPSDLAKMLPTLAAQSLQDFRCIIVDQSDDPSANARAIGDLGDDRFEHFPQKEKGRTKALNLGLRLGSAPVVAFTDDDVTLPTDWLERALHSIESLSTPGIVFGNVLACEHEPDTYFVPAITFSQLQVMKGPLKRSPGVIGMAANMFVSREVFEKSGFFDQDLGAGGSLRSGEECEFAYRALRDGFVVAQDPNLEVVHWGARPLEGGVARSLIMAGFFGLGAGYGKHLRKGDWSAAKVTFDIGAMAISEAVRAVTQMQRPRLFRFANFLSGIAAGVMRGPQIPPAV